MQFTEMKIKQNLHIQWQTESCKNTTASRKDSDLIIKAQKHILKNYDTYTLCPN